ncbi:MAG: nucleoside hydrolase [Clostridia bacterium]|nr:nucleoside hydrolase [Clostridia bacterium]
MSEPLKYVFLDTDIGPDCDDTAALAILLDQCKRLGVKLLGITHCTGSLYGLATIDIICRCFGVSVPLGTCNVRGFLSHGHALKYTKPIAERFDHAYPPKLPQPDAADALVRALSGAPDGSVTFIAIGPMNNLARFLREPETAALMRAKVNRIVCMAGCFESDALFSEFNVEMDIPAARYVVENWKGPLDFCPFEPFENVLTGACLSQYPNNPVSIAYRLHTDGGMLRPSWDLGTVAATLLGASAPYEWSARGRIDIDEVGITRFTPHPDGLHRYLRLTGSVQAAAEMIESLLISAVGQMRAQ